jgi:hypothetical protein
MPGSSQWSLFFSHPTTTSYALLSHACCIPWPSHNPWFGNPNNIWWGVQIMNSLCNFSSLLSLLPSSAETFPSDPCSETPSLYVILYIIIQYLFLRM